MIDGLLILHRIVRFVQMTLPFNEKSRLCCERVLCKRSGGLLCGFLSCRGARVDVYCSKPRNLT